MRESKFQQDVIDAFKGLGAEVFNVHGHGMQAAGWPDLQVYHPTWTGHLELKVGVGRLSTLQKIRIQSLVDRGTEAYVLRWEQGLVWLETAVAERLGSIPKDSWSFRTGNNRAHLLFKLLTG